MGNMAVEDILDELGGYGSVTLRKIKFPVNASHHNGSPKHPAEKWSLEISLEGYNGKYGSWRNTVEGATIREVTERAYAELESYVFSPEAVEDRQRYIDQNDFYEKRYEGASTYERMNGFNPIRRPVPLKPEIIWGKPRSWESMRAETKHHPLCAIHKGRACDFDCARDFPQNAIGEN